MTDTPVKRPSQKRKVKVVTVGFYPDDESAVARIRNVRRLDSDSAAIRWALRYADSLLVKQEGIAA